MLAVASWLVHAPVGVMIRTAGLWGVAGAILVLGAHNLRCWLGDAIDEREEALRQAWVLGDAACELNSTLDPDRVVAIGVRLAAEIASPPGLARPAGQLLPDRRRDGASRRRVRPGGPMAWRGVANAEHPLLAQAVRTGVATSGALDPAELGPAVRYLAAAQGVGHGGWVPVTVDGELHGVLAVAGRNRPVSEQELSRCVALSRIMEPALQNALVARALPARRAHRPSHFTFQPPRHGTTGRERRGRRPLAVVVIDVDQLKEVNDGHGHAAGDELLQLVADAIRSVLRTGDVVARLGGDEFACFMFGSDEHEADASPPVCSRRSGTPATAGRHLGSASASPAPSRGVLDDSLRRADAAMYEAKRAGGMRYSLAAPEPVADSPSAPRLPSRCRALRSDKRSRIVQVVGAPADSGLVDKGKPAARWVRKARGFSQIAQLSAVMVASRHSPLRTRA